MLLRSRGLLAELGTKPLGLSLQLLALTSEFSLDVFDSQRRVTLRRDGRVLAAPLLRLLLESDHSDHSGLEGSGNLSLRLHQGRRATGDVWEDNQWKVHICYEYRPHYSHQTFLAKYT